MKRILLILILLSIIFCQEIISLTPSEASQGEAVEMIMVVDDINLENFKSIRFSFFDSYDPYFDYYLYVHDENEDGESCVEPYATSPDTIIFSLSISATAPVGDYTTFVYTGWNDDDITVGSDMFTVNDGFYPYSTLSDIDGNIYEIAAIGDQLWMQENLEVTHFSNGDPIPQVNSDYAWWDLDTPGYTNLGYPYSQWSERMGNYYNWYAASDERGICPEGWHVATDSDFNELEVLLASENYYDPYDQSYLMENMTESIVFSNWTDGSFDTCYEP